MYVMLRPFLLLATGVAAHTNGMDMSMDGGMTMTMGNMLMYLHFTPGDNLWFIGWAPYSRGAMTGTCIGLFLLALVERWLSAMKAVMEMHWHTRALIERANRANAKALPMAGKQKNMETHHSALAQHFSLPFIFAHDFPRGIIAAALALLGFLFMLAVMTYQVSFIISIVIGLGVGETLFGRYGRAHAMHC